MLRVTQAWLITHSKYTTLLILLVFAPGIVAHEPTVNEAKPFAEAHILLQLSDLDLVKQSMVIDVASNLLKHYGGPDTVDIEVIAFGPGIHIYEKGGALGKRIQSLMVSGVRFVVCKNTLDTIERTQGEPLKLIENLIYVQTGVAHIASRAEQGYVLVRP